MSPNPEAKRTPRTELMEEIKVILLEGGKRPSHQARDELDAKGIKVTAVQDLAAGLAVLEADRNHAVLLDLDLYRAGIEAVQKIHIMFPDAAVIVMASLERLSVVDEALRQGAWDFVIKQPDLSHLQEIPQAISRSDERKRLKAEAERYQEEAKKFQEETGRLQAEIERYREEATRLQAEAERYQEEIKKVQAEAEHYRDEAKRLQTEAAPHQEETGRLQAEIERYREEATRLLAEAERYQEEIKKPQAEAEHYRDEAKRLQTEAASHQEETGRLQAETKRLQEEVRHLQSALQESRDDRPKEQAVDEVLADIAEDLKSPLAAIIGYLEIASTIGPDRAEPNQILSIQRIGALARRLFDLVMNHTGALDIEAGKFELQKSPFEIHQILEMAVQDKKGEADAKKIEIVLEAANDLPPISIDAVQIERAVEILIGNAINLSPLGSTITVSSRLQGNEVTIAVRDSGGGIFKEEIPLLFNRRKKLRRRGADINTVGLFVARHIVGMHGGRIDVQSDPLEGTTLTISLPV
ncbi:response regulator [bacterium]|nr:MAG: response regulator [bacterium]